MVSILLSNKRNRSFKEVLQEVQGYISSKHSTFNLNDKEAESRQLKNYIAKYLLDQNYEVDGFSTQELIEKLYQEMAEFGLLTPYLFSEDVEEININSWEDIKIKLSSGKEVQSSETLIPSLY